jgi:surfactin family lipopeptide synthetase C
MSLKDIEDIYELSPLQRGMLLHTIYEPASRAFFEQQSYPVHDAIDVPSLVRAWQEIVKRHPILRSSFHWEGLEKPVQVVHGQTQLPVDVQDWRSCPAVEQERRLESYLGLDLAKGFEPTVAPLIRVAIFVLAEDLIRCVLSYHLLLLDGWSDRLLADEVWTYYTAYSRNQVLRLDPVRPFRDYIAWLQGQDMTKAEVYWRRVLRGFRATTRLRVEQAAQEDSASKLGPGDLSLRLPEGLTAALKRFARENRLTLNSVMQGAWAFLLSRYGGETDVVFGTVVSGRPAALTGVEFMVGQFINTLPLRVRASADARVIPWLKEIQDQQLAMTEYEYTPLMDIQKWSELPPRAPMFESMVSFVNYPGADALQEDERSLADKFRLVENTNYPLNFMVIPGRRLDLRILYSRARFDASAASRMLGSIRTFLEELIADPARRLGSIPSMTPREQRVVLVEWNSTNRVFGEESITALFEAQARRTPEATAFVCDDVRITYRELDSRANRLARHLQSLGVGAEALVGLCIERSIDFAVALLATLKAGGAYLPLDPTYPKDRLAFMVDDAGVAVLVTTARFTSELPVEGRKIFRMDVDSHLLGRHADTALGNRLSPRQLAYVIYTSGSTGQPKGVAVEHAQLLNRLHWMWEEYPFKEDEVACQKTAAGFVDSIWEYFGSLLKGIPTVIIRDDVLRDTDRLVTELGRWRVTRLWVVPSLLRALLYLYDDLSDRLPHLRFWVTSGETLTPALYERFRAQMPKAVLYNLYGTSEVWDATWFDPTRDELAAARAPIGKPISNIRAYILDERMQPVPIGVGGELYIGGVGLARGYLNRPELTAAGFVADPFCHQPGQRLYRTGDLARYLLDGNIEFLSRIDQQVKIRGFRVEPGEIEAALSQHPQVRQAAVVAREDSRGGTALTAYVLTDQEQDPLPRDLRRFLGERLPEYMMPSAFVLLHHWPLTPSGKLDRAGLPLPGEDEADWDQTVVAPRTPVERVLAELCSDILTVGVVGISDDFFNDLGGDSLAATQLVSRIRNMFQIDLPLRVVFDSPTVIGLADRILSDPSHRSRMERTAELLLTVAECSDDDVEASLAQDLSSNSTTDDVVQHERY